MNNQAIRKELLQKIMALSEKKQAAVFWLIENYALAEEICKAETLTETQRSTYAEWAKAHDDQFFLLLLEMEKRIHSEEWL